MDAHPKSVARRAALHALLILDNNDQPLNATLDTLQVPSEARSFALEISAGSLRHRTRLDWTLQPLLKKPLTKLDAPVRHALRLALYEIALLSTPSHVVANEYAGLMRGEKLASAVAFVNAVARRLPTELRAAPDVSRDEVTHLSTEFSHPTWLVKRWIARFGFDQCRDLCAVNNQIAPLSLRVNTLRSNRETVLSSLLGRGLEARQSTLSPQGIVVSQAGSPLDWPEWKDGQIIAQDEAAQLVSILAAPLAGQNVLDVASAPGGKTTHLAQLMEDRGRVIAADRAPGRLKLVRQNARRLGLKSVETFEGNAGALSQAVSENRLPRADVVLLDAPCLGTGTLRRRPDARWKKTPQQLAELVALQRELIEAAAAVVAPGGVLVYSTCSLESEENEEQARWWLASHADWQIEAPPDSLAAWTTPDGFLQTLPQRDGCDGMFAVKFRHSD